MNSLQVLKALQELATENKIYQELWCNLQEMKQNDRDGYDAFIGDLTLACFEDKAELEEFLTSL